MSYYNLGNITIENLSGRYEYSSPTQLLYTDLTIIRLLTYPENNPFDFNECILELNLQLDDNQTVNGEIYLFATMNPNTDSVLKIYLYRQLSDIKLGDWLWEAGDQLPSLIIGYSYIPPLENSNAEGLNTVYGRFTGNTDYPVYGVSSYENTQLNNLIGTIKVKPGFEIPYDPKRYPVMRVAKTTLKFTDETTTTPTTTTTPLPVQYQSTGTDYICLTNPNITPIPSTFLPCQFFDELEIILDADEVDADGKVTLIFDHNPSGVWGDYLLIYFYGKTTTSTDLVGLAKIPDVTTAGWFDINLYNQTTGALIETQGRIHFVGGLVNATTYYGSCKVQLMAVSNPTTLPDTVNILGAEISLSSYRDSGDEEKTLTILNAINESTTTATTPITIDPIVITPERSIKTIMYEKIGDEFVELEYSDGSDSMNTEKTPFAKAFNFGTIAPGETSKTIIISLYVPYASGINNIKIACINSGGLTFTTTTFGVTTSSELRTDIEPDTYFTGINTSKDATSLFNVSVANNGQYRSEYVYLNIKTPLNNDLITGVVRYVWFIDYSD